VTDILTVGGNGRIQISVQSGAHRKYRCWKNMSCSTVYTGICLDFDFLLWFICAIVPIASVASKSGACLSVWHLWRCRTSEHTVLLVAYHYYYTFILQSSTIIVCWCYGTRFFLSYCD